MPVRMVSSWNEAQSYYLDPEWDAITLEANNQISMFLFENFPKRETYWNETVRLAKADLLPVLEPEWRSYQERNHLDDDFFTFLQWNAMGAVTEDAYREWNHPCHFFADLLKVYELGHYPCGWTAGEWPNGRLVVY